mgnify:CR=1 FL=1
MHLEPDILKQVLHKDIDKNTTTLKFKTDVVNLLIEQNPNGDLLEIGACEGHTTFVLGHVAKLLGKKIISYELNDRRLLSARAKCESLDNCQIIKKDVYSEPWDVKNIGFIFIDAKHEEDAVLSDLNNAFNIINDNGIVVVHDYGLLGPGGSTKYLIEKSNKFYAERFLGEKEGWNKLGNGKVIDWEGAVIKLV